MASTLVNAVPIGNTGWFNDFLTLKVNGVETPNNYYIGTDPTTGALPFQGAAFGTVSSLELSDINLSYWSDIQDRTGGALYYKIMSADGQTEIVAPFEIVWAHAFVSGNNYIGTKPGYVSGSMSFLTGLASGSYQLHIWAKSWGTSLGDSWLSNNSNNYVATFTVNRPVTLSGTLSNIDNTYETLKAAFDAINTQTDYSNKNIEIKIAGNTTETATAVLNQPTTASWTSLTIYPTATATISGSFVGTIIDLLGADNVTINGKLNKTGAAKSLTISHTSNADNGNRTIRLVNDAKNNTIQYCNITGKCPSTGAGIIFISSTAITDGNDNNIIEYNDINGMGAAAVGIGAGGSPAKENNNNIIRYNNIYDFYLGNVSTNSTYGMNINTNNTDFEIKGNSLYQTASRAYNGTTTAFHYGIYISAATGNNFIIQDNYIGGSAANAGGTAWTVSGGLGKPVGLYTSVGTTTASSIQNNTIANFDITTDFVTNGSSAFIGYWHAAGSVNVGTVTGNTIGSTIATGSIVVKYNAAAVGALTVGMNIVTAASPAVQVFSNNKIGGIIADYLGTVNRGHLYAVSSSGAGALTFTNNIIGSETVANSIEHKGSTYTGGQVNLRGITFGNVGVTTLTGNKIANLTATSTASMAINGIYHNGGGVNSISNNIIRDIKSAGTRVIATQGIDAGLVGIVLNSNSAGNTVGGNTIYNLENTNTTLATDVYGINFHSLNAGASTIEKNKIYNLKTASTNTAANVVGISITRGLTNTVNNMISLGNGITNAVSIVGIRKLGTANTQNNNFYHNTVVIGGSEVGTAGSSYTAAFAKVYSATDVVMNNIFINSRSNASGNLQKHYVLNVNDLTTFTSDYNVAYHPGVGGLLGAVGATDYATGETWSAATPTGTGQDAGSHIGNVNFTDAANGDLTITGLSLQDNLLRMPSLAAVTTDVLGKVRDVSYTYAGAHESTLPFLTTGLNKALMQAGVQISKTGIFIPVSEKSNIELYSINGTLIDKAVVTSAYSRSLDNGIYIVKINGKAVKFVK